MPSEITAAAELADYPLGSTFPKCDLGPATAGPKTDVRANWPACHRYEEH